MELKFKPDSSGSSPAMVKKRETVAQFFSHRPIVNFLRVCRETSASSALSFYSEKANVPQALAASAKAVNSKSWMV